MATLSKVIGIISYFPDDQRREPRIKKLLDLLRDCKRIFSTLPIIIIAQNWPNELLKDRSEITVYRYPNPLTIVGARKELRRVFLEQTNYDYLIMLDDDCKLIGSSSTEYLKQIDEHPGCWIEFMNSLLKLFAISRDILKEVDFDDITVENKTGFEDWVFYAKLTQLYPDKKWVFYKTNIWQESLSTADPLSTWFTDKDELAELRIKTKNHIKENYKK